MIQTPRGTLLENEALVKNLLDIVEPLQHQNRLEDVRQGVIRCYKELVPFANQDAIAYALRYWLEGLGSAPNDVSQENILKFLEWRFPSQALQGNGLEIRHRWFSIGLQMLSVAHLINQLLKATGKVLPTESINAESYDFKPLPPDKETRHAIERARQKKGAKILLENSAPLISKHLKIQEPQMTPEDWNNVMKKEASRMYVSKREGDVVGVVQTADIPLSSQTKPLTAGGKTLENSPSSNMMNTQYCRVERFGWADALPVTMTVNAIRFLLHQKRNHIFDVDPRFKTTDP